MTKAGTSDVALRIGAMVIAFSAMMIAMWSFTQAHLLWGGYNLVIAVVALAVFVAARARSEG